MPWGWFDSAQSVGGGGGGSGINNIVEDTSPQLGGNLDTNSFNIDNVTPTELSYLTGVTSAIQTQLNAKAASSHNHNASDINAGTLGDARVAASNVTQHVGALNHNALLNYSANRHIDHTAVSVTGGDGLAGGGTIDGNITLSVDITGQTAVGTLSTSDELQIWDVDAAELKKTTVNDIVALASGGGGGINDGDILSTGLTFPDSSGLKIFDVLGQFTVNINSLSALTDNRNLNITLVDSDSSITLATGDIAFTGAWSFPDSSGSMNAMLYGWNPSLQTQQWMILNSGLQFDPSSGVVNVTGCVFDNGGNLTVGFTFPSNGLAILDTGLDHKLNVVLNEDFTANRILTLTVNNADRTISLSEDLTLPAPSAANLVFGWDNGQGATNFFTPTGDFYISDGSDVIGVKGRIRVIREIPPATSYATADVRAGGSSPAEGIPVYDFDDSTVEYMDYLCRLENYGGGGLTFTLPWSATSATSGVCVWEMAIRRMNDDAEDIDASHTYDFNAVNDTTASLAGELSYPNITFTNGADMDSWANGEMAIVRVRRNASSGSDTMTGDAELWEVIGVET